MYAEVEIGSVEVAWAGMVVVAVSASGPPDEDEPLGAPSSPWGVPAAADAESVDLNWLPRNSWLVLACALKAGWSMRHKGILTIAFGAITLLACVGVTDA